MQPLTDRSLFWQEVGPDNVWGDDSNCLIAALCPPIPMSGVWHVEF